jgi:hypothetical protein
MPDVKYDNSGAMFVNSRKEKDTHPDRTGHGTIGGVEYWIDGWVKEGTDGKPKWLSLSFKRKDAKPAAKPASRQPDHFDDDIPF